MCAQSDQSSLCAQWVAKDSSFLHADSEDWSDWADAQADLNLRLAHMPLCWFCHEAAHLVLLTNFHSESLDYIACEDVVLLLTSSYMYAVYRSKQITVIKKFF